MTEEKSCYLELDITTNTEGEFFIRIAHPESGDDAVLAFEFSPDEHPDFNECIGNELYFWVENLMEANG